MTAPLKRPSSSEPITAVHLAKTAKPVNESSWYPIEIDDHYSYFYDHNGNSMDLEACYNRTDHPIEIILNTGIGNLSRTHIKFHKNSRSYIRFLEDPEKGNAYHIIGYHSEGKRTILTVTPHKEER